MIEWIILGLSLFAGLIPAVMVFINIRYYRPPPSVGTESPQGISILIPARNEELSIESAVQAGLKTSHTPFEVVVLDDHSTDRTAEIVAALAAKDPRVRLEKAPPLPPDWCGKQHACFLLAQLARYDYLLFQDADVRLQPDCAKNLVFFLNQSKASLVSGIPRQITITLGEKILLPLIHFILLGFLPMGGMRKYSSPAYASGCGQLFLAKKDSYFLVGGHASIRKSLHDGITLPAAYRKLGLFTDLCDVTELADCRMYRGFQQVWKGLGKNATEGLAKPLLLPFFTIILLLGQVLPVGLLVYYSLKPQPCPEKLGVSALATLISYLPRFLAVPRFTQSWLGALLHPAGILLLLWIQWYALIRKWLAIPSGWKDRVYPTN